jgi:hypothetical protein
MDAKVGFRDHADGHSLSMDEVSIIAQHFQGVPDRVSIVQNAPPVRLALIRRNDFRLDLAGACHGLHDGIRIPLEEIGHGRFKPREKHFIRNDPVLDHFGQSRDPFPARQGVQRQRIYEDRTRTMEGTNQILSQPMIDACRSADASIYLPH